MVNLVLISVSGVLAYLGARKTRTELRVFLVILLVIIGAMLSFLSSQVVYDRDLLGVPHWDYEEDEIYHPVSNQGSYYHETDSGVLFYIDALDGQYLVRLDGDGIRLRPGWCQEPTIVKETLRHSGDFFFYPLRFSTRITVCIPQ